MITRSDLAFVHSTKGYKKEACVGRIPLDTFPIAELWGYLLNVGIPKFLPKLSGHRATL